MCKSPRSIRKVVQWFWRLQNFVLQYRRIAYCLCCTLMCVCVCMYHHKHFYVRFSFMGLEMNWFFSVLLQHMFFLPEFISNLLSIPLLMNLLALSWSLSCYFCSFSDELLLITCHTTKLFQSWRYPSVFWPRNVTSHCHIIYLSMISLPYSGCEC